jgi:hypothetical protein
MAKVFYGSQIVDLVGSVGGLTFQANSSGSIVRQRPSIAGALTEAQQARNIVFSDASNGWNTLTESQRTAWNDFAALHLKTDYFGTQTKLSGRNWYMSLYINAIGISGTPIADPPTWAVPNPIGAYDYTDFKTNYDRIMVHWPTLQTQSGCSAMLFASPLTMETGIANRSNIYWLRNYNNYSFLTIDFFTEWKAYFLANADMVVWTRLNANIKFSLVAINKTSFLTSTAMFGTGKVYRG